MASFAVNHLIDMVRSALQNEASILGSVHDELNNLRLQLESMRSFLEDAERKQLDSEVERTWVANVRDVAYQVEDIIDEFMYYVHQQHSGGHFSQFLHQIIRAPKKLWVMHRIGIKLQKINNIIKVIPEWKHIYNVNIVEGMISKDLAHKWALDQRDSSRFIKEDDIVGIKDETRLLEESIMDGEMQQTLISVVGMGGSGKTTLVAKTYNNERVKCLFHCYAWVAISQTYTRDEVFRSLIREFHQSRKEQQPSDLSSKGHAELVTILGSYLDSKKYLLVLDDVWDTNLWQVIKVALPDDHIGSRIMLTTRNESVGSFSFGVRSHILQIKPLKESETWHLFCIKAFSSYPDEPCPRDLEPLALELVGRCRGLPLAVVALGGLMSSKKSITEWRSVCNNLNWQLNNNNMLEVVKSILLLSFNDLPSPLKHCFLYCCLFPEDYVIRRKRLIRLWIAEGFIQQVNRVTLAEVAESYLMELISRNMLQVVLRNESGRPKACKMHDILRELALSISERENFCIVYNGQVVTEECKARRLSIQIANVDSKSYRGMSQLRSLFVFVKHSVCFPSTLLSKFKLLRVLDLEDARIEKLPDVIEVLFNLRHLNLKGTLVAELPQCIGKLRNLETLNIRDTQIKELPKGVAELQNLQNLIMYHYNRGPDHHFRYVRGTRAPFKINKLKKLQVMSFVEAEGDLIRQLGSMNQLTRMGISNLGAKDEMVLCTSIQNLKHLRYLFLMVSDEAEVLRVDALKTPPPQLQKLILVGKLERVPCWFDSLKYLTCMYLHWSRLKEDLLPHIAALPCLGNLDLDNAFAGKELHFSGGFPKLRSLWLSNFPQLRLITIEEGAMPNIQLLCLASCKALNALPRGMEFLTNLRTLLLSGSSRLVDSINDKESEDHSKVQHIRNIEIL